MSRANFGEEKPKMPPFITGLGVLTGIIIVFVSLFVYANSVSHEEQNQTSKVKMSLITTSAQNADQAINAGNEVVLYFSTLTCESCQFDRENIEATGSAAGRQVYFVDLGDSENIKYIKEHPQNFLQDKSVLAYYNAKKLVKKTGDLSIKSLDQFFII